ncbi:MAG: PHP domain-containing protein [Dehalococcoidia bacterium]|nr:PHP domain-containing protein [Dehalococcoidia bacterium]
MGDHLPPGTSHADPRMLRADLHIHTEHSFDCSTTPKAIIRRCQKIGIDCVAVADHGTIEGALRLRETAPFKVIVAEEILTPLGEVMGMFLSETIPSNISVAEAFARIKAQNGLVCLPHPFDSMRGIHSRGFREIAALLPQVDVIEVFNSRSLRFGRPNPKALAFATEHHLLMSAGSDAHTLWEIGHAYVDMPDFHDVDSFRRSLTDGHIYGRHTCPLVHTASMLRTLKKKILR